MLTALIADDIRLERSGIRRLIERSGYEMNLFEASDGAQALLILRDTPIDILFTDIEMPQMDGLELCREARVLRPAIKLVIFSAHALFDYAQRAIESNVVGYLLKPVRDEDFARVLKAALCENAVSGVAPSRVGTPVERVLDIIEHEYAAPELCLDGIAARIFLTPSYLSYLFKKETGENLSAHIAYVRLRKAAELLDQTNLRAATIASMVGFSRPAWFSTQFKAQFGMTPARYRKEREQR